MRNAHIVSWSETKQDYANVTFIIRLFHNSNFWHWFQILNTYFMKLTNFKLHFFRAIEGVPHRMPTPVKQEDFTILRFWRDQNLFWLNCFSWLIFHKERGKYTVFKAKLLKFIPVLQLRTIPARVHRERTLQ